MISKEKIEDDLEWKKELYEMEKNSLEKGETVDSHIPSAYNTMAGTSIDRGIDELLLGGEEENSLSWIQRGTEHYLEMMDKIDEYEDVIEGSWMAHKPLNAIKMIQAAVLSDNTELIQRTAEKTLETEKTHLEKYPEWSAHYFYSKALANFLLSNKEETEVLLEKLRASNYGENFKEIFEAREKFLSGALNGEEERVLEGIDHILEYHHTEHGEDASTATDFVSLEGTANARIAVDKGIELDLEKIELDHEDYLMKELL